MKKKYLLVFSLFLAKIACLQAQTISMNPPVVAPISPEAADVQRYASYPVDYSTGIPNISIPLYEIKVGDIVLPITLSYHSAGLKPKEPSGRVGTGWTLNAEPSVMRTIRGQADNSASIALSENQALTKQQCQDLIDGKLDGEPDLYSYTLNPGGGSCYRATYNHSQFVSYPRTNDKMQISNDTATITTGDGLVYFFGNGDNAKEKTETKYNPQTTRWLCHRISSLKTGANITFSYLQGSKPHIDNYYNMHDFKIIERSSNKVYNLFSDSYYRAIYSLSLNGSYIDKIWKSSISQILSNMYSFAVQRSKLNTVSFNGHSIQFGYSSYQGEDYVSDMIVTDAGGRQIRYIQFFITPYNESTALTKLDSVRISAPDCQVRTYRFDYYGKIDVPNNETKKIDHWGFYNGVYNNVGGVPTIYPRLEFFDGYGRFSTVTDTIEGANREPKAEYTKCGILKEIVYPEGAITDFEYEGNAGAFRIDYHGDNYDENAYYAHPVGGLRIAKITESVLDNYLQKQPLNVKTYKYGLKSGGGDDNPIMGGGVIKHIVTDRDYCYESSKEWATTSGYYVKTWHAMPISNITFNNGSAVLYSFVQEDIEDKRTRQHAISKYYYDVPPHKYSDVLEYDNQYNPTKIVTGYWDLVNRQNANPNSRIIRKEINRPYDLYDALYPYSGFDTDYRHGHLIRVEHYKRNTLMSSVDYHYNNDIGRENQLQVWVYKPYCTVDYVATPLAEYNLTGDPNYPSNKVENSIYKNGSWQLDVFNWKALLSETHKQYFYRNGNRDTVETVKNYAYNNYAHTHPTDVTTANSNQTIADKYVYHENMVNTLLHHKRTVNNDSVVSEIVFAGNRPQKVRYKAGNTTVFNDKIVYDRYDHYGNIAEISTNEGKHTCYIWSYGNQHPVAEIDNITYPGLLQTLGQNETWIRELGNKYQPSEQDMNLLNNLRNQLTTSHVSTFTYKPLLGVSSITDASGFTTHYEQDNFGRLTETSIVENGQKKVLQTNEYHINDKMGILGAGFAVTSFNVEQGSLLNSGSEYVFRVYVVGGSGDFKYEWDLFWGEEWPDENYRMIHYEPQWDMNEITMTPNKPNTSISINRLKIWVTDNVTQDVKEFQTWFYVQ